MHKRPRNSIHGSYEFPVYTSTTVSRDSHGNQSCSNGQKFQSDCSPSPSMLQTYLQVDRPTSVALQDED